MASSRSASIACAALAIVAALGCSRDPGKTIVVTVAIEDDPRMAIPTRINRLELTLGDGAHTRPLSYALVDDNQRTVSVEVTLGPRAGELLTVEAGAYFDHALVVSRIVTASSADSNPIRVELKRSCVLVECPAEQTCLPRLGCKAVPGLKMSGDAGVSPDADVMDPAKPNGPPCNCDSFFPFCVGARWQYHVCTNAMPPTCDLEPKMWTVADHSTDTVPPAFLLTRLTDANPSRKWLTLANGRLLWRRDEAFSHTWNLKSISSYDPEKLRLDENFVVPGVSWMALPYNELFALHGEDLTPTVETHDDSWEVTTVEEVMPDLRRRGAPEKRFDDFGEILCHHRVDQVRGGSTREATYCFAKHIGKIFESNFGSKVETEWLLEADFPADARAQGCQPIPFTDP